jgi:hypothetical protein
MFCAFCAFFAAKSGMESRAIFETVELYSGLGVIRFNCGGNGLKQHPKAKTGSPDREVPTP